MAVMTEKLVRETPLEGHGDTAASPSPEASASNMRETEAATTAPAIIAPHDTAEVEASTVGGWAAVSMGPACSVITRSMGQLPPGRMSRGESFDLAEAKRGK